MKALFSIAACAFLAGFLTGCLRPGFLLPQKQEPTITIPIAKIKAEREYALRQVKRFQALAIGKSDPQELRAAEHSIAFFEGYAAVLSIIDPSYVDDEDKLPEAP